jgi:hypothetical protein
MDMKVINRGLAVGIPLSGKPTVPEWGIALAVQGWPINTKLHYFITKSQEVADARTTIVEQALEKKIGYLWFLDEDVVPPHFAVNKLLYELRQRQLADPLFKIIGGIYCIKADPAQPIVFRESGSGPFWEWKSGEVFECSAIGAGCMLIDTSLFSDLPKPWFKTVDEINDQPYKFRPLAEMKEQELFELKAQGNEDSYFCRAVKEAGFKILGHGGVLCEHWDVSEGLPYFLPPDSYPMVTEQAGHGVILEAK